MEDVTKHGSHNQASHGRGSKGGAGAGGLTPEQDKKMDSLSIEMFNHKQSIPMDMKQGKNTPKTVAYRQKFSSIVDEAAGILGKSPKEAFGELNRRMGVGS